MARPLVVALESQTLKHLIEDECADDAIPLPNVTGNILAKVLEYCKRHAAAQEPNEKVSKEELKKYDEDFVKVDQGTLFEIILAANYLNIKMLLDLTCQKAANIIKDMKVEEVRRIFNIKNDFTAEEEDEIRRDNAWAFE